MLLNHKEHAERMPSMLYKEHAFLALHADQVDNANFSMIGDCVNLLVQQQGFWVSKNDDN